VEITRQSMDAQHYIYVDRECPYGPEIADAMGSAIGEVFAFAAQSGITPLDMPMSVYLQMDKDMLRFRGGVIVSAQDAAKASGPIKSDVLPAGDVMSATHVGPYDDLAKSHQDVWSYMETHGLPAAMPVWEIYTDDPGEVAQDKIRTKIFRALAT